MLKSQMMVNKALDFVTKQKLAVDSIQRNKLNLPQIYNKFVKLGSVTTGTGRNKKQVKSTAKKVVVKKVAKKKGGK